MIHCILHQAHPTRIAQHARLQSASPRTPLFLRADRRHLRYRSDPHETPRSNIRGRSCARLSAIAVPLYVTVTPQLRARARQQDRHHIEHLSFASSFIHSCIMGEKATPDLSPSRSPSGVRAWAEDAIDDRE